MVAVQAGELLLQQELLLVQGVHPGARVKGLGSGGRVRDPCVRACADTRGSARPRTPHLLPGCRRVYPLEWYGGHTRGLGGLGGGGGVILEPGGRGVRSQEEGLLDGVVALGASAGAGAW